MSVHVFGIRHHGPGSARSVLEALEALAPDVVLVEGPPDAEAAIPLIADPRMKPPVALLVYASGAPHRAVFYPFAGFSPEWQALRYALERGVPARFMDLPQMHQLVDGEPVEGSGEVAEKGNLPVDDGDDDASRMDDPIGIFSRAAGYSDRELWWEHQVEQRRDATGIFQGILEAVTSMREGRPPPSRREAQREAYMRRTIRVAEKEGFQRIAVVCGAWHGPALTLPRTIKEDDALLRGLPKVKVEATWIPWTWSRLSYRSGYGAGIASPGWYSHLWESHATAEWPPVRWLATTARLLRASGIDASSASVIEATRLADALAALRGLPMPGLAELGEATRAVFCHGEESPMALIRERLEIGDRLGEVPPDVPAVPLQRDLAAWQKRLRLKPTVEVKALDLDLRQESDRAKSRLLHRLQLLSIPWGRPARGTGRELGTFHELWRLEWRPELAVAIVEANVHGNTVESAATAKVRRAAQKTHDLSELTELLDGATLAELPGAVDEVLERVQALAAVSADVRRLMDALVPLARTARYGSVRETRQDELLRIVDGLFDRIAVGLVGACLALDDAAAREMLESLTRTDESLRLLDRAAQREEWTLLLRELLGRDAVHGLVRGAAVRILVEERHIDPAELHRLARLALSPAAPPAQAAAWAEGLLRGSALLLLQHDGFWSALDQWLRGLAEDSFVELLPLVRRAFVGFGGAERRAMGERVKKLAAGTAPAPATAALDLDPARVALVLPVLSQILGVDLHG